MNGVDNHSIAAQKAQQTFAKVHSRRARGRLGRHVLSLSVVAVAFCAVIVWERDARHIEAARAQIRPFIEPLERFLTENGTLPLTYPIYPDQSVSTRTPGFSYADPDIIRWARKSHKPAIVGYGESRSLVGRNGRAVVIYDNGAIRDAWRTNRELDRVLEKQRESAAAVD